MAKPTKQQIEAMEKLGLTSEEIQELIKSDLEIDRGKKMPFDLTPEQTKVTKEFTKVGTKTVYNFTKKKHKKNEIKADLIEKLADFMKKNAENVEIINAERQISFKINENTYELTLIQKRKLKK